jgi:thymidylate synthase
MVAHITNKKPKTFIHFSGNAHVYLNHVDNALIQIKRKPFPFPNLKKFRDDIKDISDFQLKDFELENYKYHPDIKYEMAV